MKERKRKVREEKRTGRAKKDEPKKGKGSSASQKRKGSGRKGGNLCRLWAYFLTRWVSLKYR